MKLSHIVIGAVALLVGAFLVVMIRPTTQASPTAQLVDGKYLVVEGPDGHWVYEKTENGFVVRIKELSPSGLQAIWGLQSKYLPHAVDLGGGTSLVNVPATQYSTETGSFQVLHRFYRFLDDKLVEVKMEGLKAP